MVSDRKLLIIPTTNALAKRIEREIKYNKQTYGCPDLGYLRRPDVIEHGSCFPVMRVQASLHALLPGELSLPKYAIPYFVGVLHVYLYIKE